MKPMVEIRKNIVDKKAAQFRKHKKQSRLSFRISPLMSERIDMAIEHSGGDIRDRSEFGTKAVMAFLNHLEQTTDEIKIIYDALLLLGSKYNLDLPEIKKLHKHISDRERILSRLTVIEEEENQKYLKDIHKKK